MQSINNHEISMRKDFKKPVDLKWMAGGKWLLYN